MATTEYGGLSGRRSWDGFEIVHRFPFSVAMCRIVSLGPSLDCALF
jgi:hypothetical protein